jgi:hypothetical protein
MAVSRNKIDPAWTPTEYEDETRGTRCPDCGNPASYPGIDQDWCIACAQPVYSHPTGKDVEHRTRLENRYWEKVDIRQPDECWPWTAGTFQTGYGAFALGGREGQMHPAHRVAVMLDQGLQSPTDINGDVVMHECHNRQCCNPRHLTPGSYAENNHGTIEAGNSGNKFSEAEIREIRRLSAETDLTQTEIGDRFGTDQTMVSAIVRREQYDWVE